MERPARSAPCVGCPPWGGPSRIPAELGPRARTGRGGGAGPVPGLGRHGHRPHPGSPPAGRVLVAPRSGVATGRQLDPAYAARIRAQAFEERALNETLAHTQATLAAREAIVDAMRPTWVPWFDRQPFADALGRLSAFGHRSPGRAHPGHRGVRLAPLRDGCAIHGLHGAGAERRLQWGAHPLGRHHPRRQGHCEPSWFRRPGPTTSRLRWTASSGGATGPRPGRGSPGWG